jgi:hypothetical protein
MNLSPKLRALLGVLSVAVTTFGGLIATDQVLASSLPSWVGVVISVLGAVLAYLLAPSALGGTQQGLVNPSLTVRRSVALPDVWQLPAAPERQGLRGLSPHPRTRAQGGGEAAG